jgi:hypothetical protein
MPPTELDFISAFPAPPPDDDVPTPPRPIPGPPSPGIPVVTMPPVLAAFEPAAPAGGSTARTESATATAFEHCESMPIIPLQKNAAL